MGSAGRFADGITAGGISIREEADEPPLQPVGTIAA